MKADARYRRALVLTGLAIACGGLAAARTGAREREVEARVGPLVPVLVARDELRPGTAATRLGARLATREVPATFAPPDALSGLEGMDGLVLSAAVPRGGYLTAGSLAPPESEAEDAGPPLRRGERAVEVAFAGAVGPAAGLEPGVRADVLVTAEGRSGAGSGSTRLALEAVEVLDIRRAEPEEGGGGERAARSASAVATLRVTARQAIYLAAAQAFATEVRLLARPPGDGRRVGAAAVASGEL